MNSVCLDYEKVDFLANRLWATNRVVAVDPVRHANELCEAAIRERRRVVLRNRENGRPIHESCGIIKFDTGLCSRHPRD